MFHEPNNPGLRNWQFIHETEVGAINMLKIKSENFRLNNTKTTPVTGRQGP
jgi:hypothetical protein